MDIKNVKGTMLCSEILDLHLLRTAGRQRELKANLEQIWAEGALLLTDLRVPLSTPTWFAAGGREFRGTVTARKFVKGLGYFVEVQFASNSLWSKQEYRPKHLLNPLVLLANRIFAAMPHPPVSPAERCVPTAFEAPLGFRHARRHAV
jgi:hypothetical protein